VPSESGHVVLVTAIPLTSLKATKTPKRPRAKPTTGNTKETHGTTPKLNKRIKLPQSDKTSAVAQPSQEDEIDVDDTDVSEPRRELRRTSTIRSPDSRDTTPTSEDTPPPAESGDEDSEDSDLSEEEGADEDDDLDDPDYLGGAE
jgi:hypothetical protein